MESLGGAMAHTVSAVALFNKNQQNGLVDSYIIDSRRVGKDPKVLLSQQEFLGVGNVLYCSVLGQSIDGGL